MAKLSARTSLIAGTAAAVGASLCCVGPLVLLALGVGGTWIANLTALEPYRPLFVGLTLLFLGLAFRRLYLVPQVCMPGALCAAPRTAKRQRHDVLDNRRAATRPSRRAVACAAIRRGSKMACFG